MYRRFAVALFVVLVASSLVGAPVTMADWGEQASFSAERIDRSEIDEETPVLRYENLSLNARDAVRRAIDSPDGHHTVYGSEDWPDRFLYSDYVAPGRGQYVVVYEGGYYELTTYAGGGFPFVYWLYELPFVAYGLVLARVGYRTYSGERSALTAALAAVPGVAFHLLGPEFDFPLLAPMRFVGLGAVAAVAAAFGLVWDSDRERRSRDADEK